MKRGMFLILFCIFFTSFVQSAYLGPSAKYCTHMGYEIKYLGEKEIDGELYCIFDENNKCVFDEFWNGSCGQKFIKEISCRKEGEVVVRESYQLYGGKTSLYEECCKGLVAAEKPYVFNTGDFLYCYKPLKLKMEQIFNFNNLFLILVLAFVLIIVFIIRKLFYRKKSSKS